MQRSLNLVKITLTDFIVRSAYQMGKTPLLPIFAASLGANSAFLGFIVSVSTLTGMVLKPLIGLLSDRWGRRWWLVAGTLFFAGMPFFYHLVHTPEQLFCVRIVHGLATAIYGPVTLAFVAEQAMQRRAERLGWFGMARNGSYIVGPATAGWLLLTLDPVDVFTLIGLLSCLAFVPVFLLSEPSVRNGNSRLPVRRHISAALGAGIRTPSVWLSGSLELTVFLALYAVRAFLPVYALSLGISVALVGVFFSVQEAAHLVLRPLGGRLGDRMGYLETVSLGMIAMGLPLSLLSMTHSPIGLLSLAVLVGGAQALVFPSTVALVSEQIEAEHIGAGMGLIGTFKNIGKVAGPILGGGLVHWLDFASMFRSMAALLLFGAVAMWYRNYRRQEGSLHHPGVSGRTTG